MPRIVIEEAHALRTEAARERAEALGALLARRAGLSLTWRSDTEAQLERTGARGTLRIEPARFLFTLDLSFALSVMKGQIEGWIREGLQAPRTTPPAPEIAPR